MRIRQAVSEDSAQLSQLFVEMEQHYGTDNSGLKAVIEKRIAEWLDLSSSAILLVAEEESGDFLGHISAMPIFPSGAGQSAMFVKDIFVRDRARGRGIGEALLRACAQEATRRGAPRLELTVDQANSGAEKLYRRLGAEDTRKSYLRWEGQSLNALAGAN